MEKIATSTQSNRQLPSKVGDSQWLKTYSYTEQDLDRDLAKKFFPNVVVFHDIQEIPFREILQKKVRFLSVPKLQELHTPIDVLKRKLIKVLALIFHPASELRSPRLN